MEASYHSYLSFVRKGFIKYLVYFILNFNMNYVMQKEKKIGERIVPQPKKIVGSFDKKKEKKTDYDLLPLPIHEYQQESKRKG